MKKLFIILILICGVVSCEKAKDTEFPLILPAAAEGTSSYFTSLENSPQLFKPPSESAQRLGPSMDKKTWDSPL